MPAAARCRTGDSCMKSSASGASLLLTAAVMVTVALAAPASQQQPTFRTGARTVAVYATVTDKDGRLMPDLERDVFEIRDNGKPQPLTVFSREVQPITVVTMLDRSGSMRGNVGLVEKAAEEFVRRLGPEDKARIGTFAERIQIQPEGFTNDREALLQVLAVRSAGRRADSAVERRGRGHHGASRAGGAQDRPGLQRRRRRAERRIQEP